MTNDVMLFLSKRELEFIKNGMIEACAGMGTSADADYEFIIKLAAKIIQASEENVNAGETITLKAEKTNPWGVVTTPFTSTAGGVAAHN